MRPAVANGSMRTNLEDRCDDIRDSVQRTADQKCIDCHPQPGASQETCEAGGCFWCSATTANVPGASTQLRVHLATLKKIHLKRQLEVEVNITESNKKTRTVLIWS
ncbi:Maltase-glucoamylase, intestinal [Manis javanica]|nr:Maltase-glucoamylase, intestinal [Manis javanica]